MEWISYYSRIWNSLDEDDKDAVKKLAVPILQRQDESERTDYSGMINLLAIIKDTRFFRSKGTAFLANNFNIIKVVGLLRLLETYSLDCFEPIFKAAAAKGKPSIMRQILVILVLLSKDQNAPIDFVLQQLELLPGWLKALRLAGSRSNETISSILRNVLLLAELKTGDKEWQNDIADVFTTETPRDYVNDILVATILEHGLKTLVGQKIMAVCVSDLQRRIDNKPQPPANWSRPLPETKDNPKVWALLTDFLRSPEQQVFDYQALQGFRVAMEAAISSVVIDLRMETIKKGSPHTLRLIKTQAAYERELAKWQADVDLLQKIKYSI